MDPNTIFSPGNYFWIKDNIYALVKEVTYGNLLTNSSNKFDYELKISIYEAPKINFNKNKGANNHFVIIPAKNLIKNE
jgi:hypothetical protein